ncbi:MAG: hypothetical protein ACPGNV_11560 [Mangrovicoccus sp.]
MDFTKLKSIIHETTGITIADGRKTMLLSRLRGRLREIEEKKLQRLCQARFFRRG